MAHLAEPPGGLRPHTLRGGIRRAQLGVLLLERHELAQQVVVLGIGDLRVVEDVIAVVVVLEQAPHFRRPSGNRPRGHWYYRSVAAGSPISAWRSQPAISSSRCTSVSSKWSGVTEIMSASIAAKSVPSSGRYEGSMP